MGKIILEDSKDEKKVIRVIRENKSIYIGSKYRVEKDINNFIDDIITSNKKNIIIFGLAAGEYLDKLMEMNDSKVIIIEPKKDIISLNKDKLYKYEKNHKLKVILYDRDNIYDEINNFFNNEDLKDVLVKVYCNYGDVFKEEIEEFYSIYKSLLLDRKIQENTKIEFGKLWFDSFFYSLKFFYKEYFVSNYKDKYKNKPAIIVSAGPSLSKNISELKETNDDFIIIPGGRTVYQLVNRDIKFDFLTIVDPGQISYDLVKDIIGEINVPLLCYEGTNKDVMEKHNGDKILFTQQKELSDILEEEIGDISSGGSVAHISTMFATVMGCNPIIFIGQDCAYTDDKLHADEVKDKERGNKIKVNEGDFFVPAVGGGTVRTSIVLDGFRRYIEKIIINNKETTFINATEGGAKIKGTIEMSLNDVIRKYGGSKIDKKIVSKDINFNYRKLKIVKFLESYSKDLKDVINLCNDGVIKLEKLNKKYISGKNIEKDLLNLNYIDRSIEEISSKLNITKEVLYPITYQLLNNEEYIINEDEKENIKINKYYIRNKFIYNNVRETLKECKKVVDITLREFKGDKRDELL